MVSDLSVDIMHDVLNKRIEALQGQGKNTDEIAEELSKYKIEEAFAVLVERMSSYVVQDAKTSMYERVLQERARTAAFLAHNEQVWFKGFVASEAMYLMTIEAAEEYCSILSELPEGLRKEKQFRFVALKQLHGRACQEYLEIVFLLKNGFADGAYARWRSLYELSVIADFIGNNDEEVAKAYIEQSKTDAKWPNWAKKAPEFSGYRGNVTFKQIEDKSSFVNAAWKGQHDLSCQIIHASPQGTFNRLGSYGFASTPMLPAGHSDYGISLPAINSAISFAIVSAIFMSLYSTGDGSVYIQTLTEWTNVVKNNYLEIEKNSFNSEAKRELPNPENNC